MEKTDHIPQDIVEKYFHDESERKRYDELFFRFCKKFNICWETGTARDRCFVEEVTRVTYERDHAQRHGTSLSGVRRAFSKEYFTEE